MNDSETMTSTTDSMMNAARGIFLGAAVGDALGWPQEARGGLVGGQKERDRAVAKPEFRTWTRYGGHYRSRYEDPVLAGEYSDDTQLLLATARACLAGDRWWNRLTEVELPSWPLYQRGGGGAVLAAAGSWASGRPPWRTDQSTRLEAAEKRYRGAGANGVAMRIAPHVLWAQDPDDLIERVVRDGITTHGHPRALVGALVYAFALRHAASSHDTHGFGDSIEAAEGGLIDVDKVLPVLPPDWGTPQDLELFANTWQTTNKETSQLLALITDSLQRGAISNPETTLEQLGCTDPKINGAGTVSAAAAIYLASRFAARPQGGLVSAAFLRRADTDTLASLTAAILGALHDARWLGDMADEVQDADYIVGLAMRTATRVVDPPPWPSRRPERLRRELRDTLLARRDTVGEFPDGRRYRLDDSALLHDGQVLRARLRLDDGQSAVVDLQTDLTSRKEQPSRGGPEQSVHQPQLPIEQHSNQREPSTASNERAMPAPPSPEAVFGQRQASVILPTRSAARAAAFYAQITGRNIPVRSGTAAVTSGVLLHQSAIDTAIDVSSIVVYIPVDDLPAVARRLGVDISTTSTGIATIETRDPDGRPVLIGQPPAITQFGS